MKIDAAWRAEDLSNGDRLCLLMAIQGHRREPGHSLNSRWNAATQWEEMAMPSR